MDVQHKIRNKIKQEAKTLRYEMELVVGPFEGFVRVLFGVEEWEKLLDATIVRAGIMVSLFD